MADVASHESWENGVSTEERAVFLSQLSSWAPKSLGQSRFLKGMILERQQSSFVWSMASHPQ